MSESHLSKSRQLISLDVFLYCRLCIEMLKTSIIDIVKYCHWCFGFDMPSNF